MRRPKIEFYKELEAMAVLAKSFEFLRLVRKPMEKLPSSENKTNPQLEFDFRKSKQSE